MTVFIMYTAESRKGTDMLSERYVYGILTLVTSAKKIFQGHHLVRNKISLDLIERAGIHVQTLIIESRSGEYTTR